MSKLPFGDPAASGSGVGPNQDAIVKAARAELRRRLPELRKLPGCPQGSDEDILATSYPPYYTACPNPFIADWLASLDRPGDENRVDPGPFASDVSEGKGNPFYKAHSYPTKVPHPAIMRFILHYTKPGDVVLDGFAGTGMTGVAAQACGAPDAKTKAAIEAELGKTNIQWGARRSILGDLGPSATFISAGVNLPIDSDEFDRASKAVLARFTSEYGWMYRTTVRPKSGKPFEADIDFVVWSEVFTCPHCGGEIVFYDAAFDHAAARVREEFGCSTCGASVTKAGLEERRQKVRTLHGENEKLEMRAVAIQWRTATLKGSKSPDADDFGVLDRVLQQKVKWFPSHELPWLHRVHNWAIPDKGFRRVHHFWPDRALVCLALLWSMAAEEANPLTRNALQFWIEQGFWGFSWMNRYVPGHYSHVNQYLTGVYYIPSLHAEPSPRYNLVGTLPSRGKRASLAKLWADSPGRAGQTVITTGSSTSLPVPAASVDYVFVDPPFGENLYYSDLAYLTEAWHKIYTSVAEEAIVDKNAKRPKSEDDYGSLIRRCFAEFFRVLKPGRWMTVEFSNSSNSIWMLIQHALASAGFVVADTRVIDKEQLSFSQLTAQNAVKHDLVISAYKPAEATESTFEIAKGNADGAWAFVREHLSRLPVKEGERGKAIVIRERQADRIYERMVGYHVARNTLVPMTAAEFYTGLDQRSFLLRDGMYFLPDQVETYERFRITFKDLADQVLFIRDEATAVQWLRQKLKDRQRAFSDIHPMFMRELQSGKAEWEALPDLREMLEDNFVLDEDGRWSVPDPKKSEHLDQLRTRTLLKEFESYKMGKGPLVRFRSEAVRAGFKGAWARKDFATIVAVGRRLPSDVFVEDSALLHYYRNAERLTAGR